MATLNLHSSLMSRTRFAQCRTAYYTIRNTLLGLNQRKLYVVEPFELLKSNRQLAAIKKAYAARRNSRKGPFQHLLPPHSYIQLFGDPAYYSINELLHACSAAAEMRVTDRMFWWQICEKIRKVRDVVDIKSLLLCIRHVIGARYYDHDLMRILSREFADDMEKLSLVEISQLLQVYFAANVYSVDLIKATGKVATRRLMAQVKNVVSSKSSRTAERRGDMATEEETDLSVKEYPETLANLAKGFTYIGYQNRDLYLSIAYLTIRNWDHLDLSSKCILVANLDPRDFQPQDTYDEISVSREAGMNITKQIALKMARLLVGLQNVEYHPETQRVSDTFQTHDALYSYMPEDDEGYNKSLRNLLLACTVASDLSKVVRRLVDNADYIEPDRTGKDIETAIDSVLCSMESMSATLVRLMQQFYAGSKSLYRNQGMLPGGEGQSGNASIELSALPSVKAVVHKYVESILNMVSAVNASLRFKNTALTIYEDASIVGRNAKFSVADSNIHSQMYDIGTLLSHNEGSITSRFVEAIRNYGLQSHDPELLTTAYETLAIISCMKGENVKQLVEAVQPIQDMIALEIVKDLVSYRDEQRYRIMLALRNSRLGSNAFLEHALRRFTKYIRKKKSGTEIRITAPHRFDLVPFPPTGDVI